MPLSHRLRRAARGLSALLLTQAIGRIAAAPKTDFAERRRRMVDEQLSPRGITDPRVLKAMGKVPRHLFVPDREKNIAYEDFPLSIGDGQTISQPYIVALMSELLRLKTGEKVLEVGTGSGYQAAVLAELGAQVYTIEIIEPLARNAARALKQAGYGGVQVREGDGYQGWKEAAPFDAIIVTCAPESVPPLLEDQLAEGGRLVIPLGKFPQQTLYVFNKENDRLIAQPVVPVLFVPMTGDSQWEPIP